MNVIGRAYSVLTGLPFILPGVQLGIAFTTLRAFVFLSPNGHQT